MEAVYFLNNYVKKKKKLVQDYISGREKLIAPEGPTVAAPCLTLIIVSFRASAQCYFITHILVSVQSSFEIKHRAELYGRNTIARFSRIIIIIIIIMQSIRIYFGEITIRVNRNIESIYQLLDSDEWSGHSYIVRRKVVCSQPSITELCNAIFEAI